MRKWTNYIDLFNILVCCRLYFKKFGQNPGGVARVLGDRNYQEHSHSFVNICFELEKTRPDWDKDQVFNSAVEKYRDQVPYLTDPKRTGEGGVQDESEVDALNERIASRRHDRKPPIISAQSLLSLFKEAKEQQGKEADKSETHETDKAKEK